MTLSKRIPSLVAVSIVATGLVTFSAAALKNTGPFAYKVKVTVSGRKAVPDRDPLKAHSHYMSNGRKVASTISWMAPGAGDKLRVTFDDQGCVTTPACTPGRCTASTIANFKGAPKSCKYRIWIEGQTDPYDPVVIVDDCCAVN